MKLFLKILTVHSTVFWMSNNFYHSVWLKVWVSSSTYTLHVCQVDLNIFNNQALETLAQRGPIPIVCMYQIQMNFKMIFAPLVMLYNIFLYIASCMLKWIVICTDLINWI
jgi:hypothetical protein